MTQKKKKKKKLFSIKKIKLESEIIKEAILKDNPKFNIKITN